MLYVIMNVLYDCQVFLKTLHKVLVILDFRVTFFLVVMHPNHIKLVGVSKSKSLALKSAAPRNEATKSGLCFLLMSAKVV